MFTPRGLLCLVLPGAVLLALVATAPLSARPPLGRPAQSGPPNSFTPIGQSGGRTTAIALAGGYVYLGQGARVVAARVQGAAAPQPIGQTDALFERVAGLGVVGDRVFVAAGRSGLWVVDVSDPAAPSALGGTTLAEVEVDGEAVTPDALRVSVLGHLAAVLATDHVQLVDVADPAHPRVQAVHRLHPEGPDSIRGVALIDRYAYVAATEDGLEVLDLRDPAAPTVVTRLATVRPRSVAVAGARAFVALEEPPGLLVLDASDPAAPREVARLALATAPTEVWVTGQRVYLAQEASDSGRLDDGSCPACAVAVVDVADPAQPRLLGVHTLGEPGGVTALAFDGTLGLSGSATGRLATVDLTDPKGLRVAGAYTPGWFHSTDLVAQGGRLYALDGYGQLQVTDIASPGAPGRTTTFAPGFAATHLTVGDGQVFLSRRAGGLAVVDASDLAAIRVVGVLDAPWEAQDLAVDGGRLVAAAGPDGLRVVDVANPSEPVDRTGSPVAVPAGQVALAAGVRYAHVVPARTDRGQAPGVQVYDLSDPANPHLVATYAGNRAVLGLAVDAGRALVADSDGNTFSLFDVSEPAAPKPVGPVDLAREGNPAEQVVLSWPLAAAVGTERLTVRDLSRAVGQAAAFARTTVPTLRGLALAGGFAYLGHGAARGYTVVALPTGDQTALTGYAEGAPGVRAVERQGDRAHMLAGVVGEAGDRDLLVSLDVHDPARPTVIGRYTGLTGTRDLASAGSDVLLALTEAAELHVLTSQPAGRVQQAAVVPLDDAYQFTRVDGPNAWLFTENRAQVLDVSVPARPVAVAKAIFPFNDAISDAVVRGGWAMVVTAGGFRLLDVHQPAAPRLLGELKGMANWSCCVVAADNWVFTTDADDTRLLVIDISNPSTPRRAALLALPGHVGVMALDGDQLALGDPLTHDLMVVDVSAPNRPRLARVDHLWNVHDMVLSGGQAWLAAGPDGYQVLGMAEAGLTPATKATTTWAQVAGLAREETLVAVAAGGAGLHLLSIADPGYLPELGRAHVADARDVALSGGQAYVAAGADGLRVFDVSEPASPRGTDVVEVDGASQVVLRDTSVFVMGSEGLSVVDVGRSPPTVVGTLDRVDGRLDVSLDGTLGVTTNGDVLDLADPAQPDTVGRLGTSAIGNAVALAGTRAYVAYPDGLRVYELSDPTDPRELGGAAVPFVFDVSSLAAAGKLLLAGTQYGSVSVFDLSNPDRVRLVVTFERHPQLAPVGDPFGRAAKPTRAVTALAGVDDGTVLAGGTDDGLWWLAPPAPVEPTPVPTVPTPETPFFRVYLPWAGSRATIGP